MKRTKAKEQDYSASMPKYKRTVGGELFTIFNAIFMIAFVVITLYPVLNTLAVSFNDGTDAARRNLSVAEKMVPAELLYRSSEG